MRQCLQILYGRQHDDLYNFVQSEGCANRNNETVADTAGLALRNTFVLGLNFKCHTHFFGAHESPTDVSIFRRSIERDQPIAVLAVGLKAVADFFRPLSEYLRAFRAFDFYSVVDQEIRPEILIFGMLTSIT